jgi:DNA invertase Pin-like site-specific DNA recombinase
VSTHAQSEHGAGIEAQKRAIRAEAKRRGWKVVRVYEDVVSGKSMNGRHGLHAALEAVETGDAAVVVVAKLDRLSRSLIDFAALVERSRKKGWGIVALDLGVDMTTPSSEMVAGVLAVLAPWERRMISERTKAALAVKRSQGVRIGVEPRIVGDLAKWIRAQRRRGVTLRRFATG